MGRGRLTVTAVLLIATAGRLHHLTATTTTKSRDANADDHRRDPDRILRRRVMHRTKSTVDQQDREGEQVGREPAADYKR